MVNWQALGLDAPEHDPKKIRTTYARRLKRQRPDEDAEAFQALRSAYEAALAWAAEAEAEAEEASRDADADDGAPTGGVPQTDNTSATTAVAPFTLVVAGQDAPAIDLVDARVQDALATLQRAQETFDSEMPLDWEALAGEYRALLQHPCLEPLDDRARFETQLLDKLPRRGVHWCLLESLAQHMGWLRTPHPMDEALEGLREHVEKHRAIYEARRAWAAFLEEWGNSTKAWPMRRALKALIDSPDFERPTDARALYFAAADAYLPDADEPPDAERANDPPKPYSPAVGWALGELLWRWEGEPVDSFAESLQPQLLAIAKHVGEPPPNDEPALPWPAAWRDGEARRLITDVENTGKGSTLPRAQLTALRREAIDTWLRHEDLNAEEIHDFEWAVAHQITGNRAAHLDVAQAFINRFGWRNPHNPVTQQHPDIMARLSEQADAREAIMALEDASAGSIDAHVRDEVRGRAGPLARIWSAVSYRQRSRRAVVAGWLESQPAEFLTQYNPGKPASYWGKDDESPAAPPTPWWKSFAFWFGLMMLFRILAAALERK